MYHVKRMTAKNFVEDKQRWKKVDGGDIEGYVVSMMFAEI